MAYREDVIEVIKNTDDEKVINLVYAFLRSYLGVEETVRLIYKKSPEAATSEGTKIK